MFPTGCRPPRRRRALDAAFKERISVDGGKLEKKDLVMRARFPRSRAASTTDGVHAHMLIVASSSALVLIVVSAKSGTDRLYQALETSLIVG